MLRFIIYFLLFFIVFNVIRFLIKQLSSQGNQEKAKSKKTTGSRYKDIEEAKFTELKDDENQK